MKLCSICFFGLSGHSSQPPPRESAALLQKALHISASRPLSLPLPPSAAATCLILSGFLLLLAVAACIRVITSHGVLYFQFVSLLFHPQERKLGLIITGNSMLYHHKQHALLQIMTHKQRCRRHVPFDRGNRYLSSHMMVQRLVSQISKSFMLKRHGQYERSFLPKAGRCVSNQLCTVGTT